MNEGVGTVDPVEQRGSLEEPLLEVDFEEDVKLLLEVDDLEGVLSSNVYSAFDEG